MEEFDPIKHIENSNLSLDNGEWPTFHDAEVHNINIWRGDIRPEDNVWIGPVVEATFELCALQYPYIVSLKFLDCESMKLEEFNHQNVVYDLNFTFEDRGTLKDGRPLHPFICVTFEQTFGMALSFKCMRIEVLERREIK